MPVINRRQFHINTPFPATKQLKIKVNCMTTDPSDFSNFALRNFRYSLQKKQSGGKIDLFYKDDEKANTKVDASYLAHKPTIPDKSVFINYKTFKLGTSVPEEFLYSEYNERDEMNGNWIQTWFKIGPKPEYKDETSMINIHGFKECATDGGCEFQHKVTYNYLDSNLYYVDEFGEHLKILNLSKFNTMERWNFICLLVRKQGGGHGQRFEVLAATVFDDIEKELVSKEGEELGGEEFQYHPGLRRDLRIRRLGVTGQKAGEMSGVAMTPRQMESDKQDKLKSEKLVADAKMLNEQQNAEKTKDTSKRNLNEDDWDKSQETQEEEEDEDGEGGKKKKKVLVRRQKKTRPFKSQKDNPRIIFKRKGSFMVAESTLDVGFALGDFKSTTSDFVGSLYGSNYYKTFTFPNSKVYNFYMLEDNPHAAFGTVKNWADATDKTSGTMVYQEENGEVYPFHDDYTYFGGDTFMESILAKASDSPNIDNTLIQGAFEVKDNLEYWRMTHKLATNYTKPLFLTKMANGTEVLRIDHYVEIPKYTEEKKDKYFTTSKLLIKALRGWNRKGKMMYKKMETKVFNLSKLAGKTMTYTFQFWTNLKRKYFMKQKKPIMDMFIHFRDNQETEFDVKSYSSPWTNKANYTMLASHTKENFGVEPPLYNHKLVTLLVSQASHQYEKDFANDSLAKFETKLHDSALMCYLGYMPVFDKQHSVLRKELSEERAKKRAERKEKKRLRKEEIKKKQEAKEKAKAAARKSLEEEHKREQDAIEAQKEAQEQALAAIKAKAAAAKKAIEDAKKPKAKETKKTADKKKKARVLEQVDERKLSPSGTTVDANRELKAATAEEKKEAAVAKDPERKIEYTDPPKMEFQKPLCSLFPTKKSECYRDDHQKCLSCRLGYVPDGLVCNKCVDRCLTCDRPNKCTMCQDGYVLKKLGPRDTVCVKCDELKDIFDAHNKRCIPFKDMDYKEKLKPFQDKQFKRFTFPEVQIPNKKDLFMYVQYYFEWQISPYKIMIDIEALDDAGQKTPYKLYLAVRDWSPRVPGKKKYKTVVRFRVPVKKNRKVKLSISPSIDSKEDFTFLFIRKFKFSYQFYNEDPYVLNTTEKKLNMKDIVVKKVDKKKDGKKDKKGVRRIGVDGKPVLVDDSNLYKKIAEEDIISERITKIGSLSLEDLRDVITKLTMIKALPNESQIALRALHLNLRPAQRRCENIHGGNNCTTVWGTLAVKKCRGGYIR